MSGHNMLKAQYLESSWRMLISNNYKLYYIGCSGAVRVLGFLLIQVVMGHTQC